MKRTLLKTSRLCAGQGRCISKHHKTVTTIHKMQERFTSRLAVCLEHPWTSLNCRTAATWRSSQSGLRGRNSALGSSQALRRWWNRAASTLWPTRFCRVSVSCCRACERRSWMPSSESLWATRRFASVKSWNTTPSSTKNPAQSAHGLK